MLGRVTHITFMGEYKMKLFCALIIFGLVSAYQPFCQKAYAKDIKPSLEQQKNDFMADIEGWEAVSEVKLSGGRSVGVFLNGERDTKAQIISFNTSIKQNNLSGKILLCRRSIEIPVGRANSNTSHGGVCLYSDKGQYTPVYICNDEMVGHFKMTPLDGTINSFDGSILTITNFTMQNCFGG
jgi:hypothetical protein